MTSVVSVENVDKSLIDAMHAFLMLNEAAHCLQLSFLPMFVRGQSTDTRWWAAQDDGEVVAVASLTSPHNLLVSKIASNDSIGDIASHLADEDVDLPGVLAPDPVSAQFAEAWSKRQGVSFDLDMREAVYECDSVIFPERMDGSARFANELDVPWMIPWIRQFHIDADVDDVARNSNVEDSIRNRLHTGGFVLWLDDSGEVVSMAGYANPTPNGIRVGPVYTPSEHRNRGYGAAVSATVTQHLLDSGRKFAFLYADLDNPISNHVYKKIGYRHVSDFSVHRFG